VRAVEILQISSPVSSKSCRDPATLPGMPWWRPSLSAGPFVLNGVLRENKTNPHAFCLATLHCGQLCIAEYSLKEQTCVPIPHISRKGTLSLIGISPRFRHCLLSFW
jgi:hypothetical protein